MTPDITPPLVITGPDIRIGQYSTAGIKDENEDFHGALLPDGPLRATKGIVLAIADGISGSGHGREASECAVTGFLNDYLSTPETWSVKRAMEQVLGALNRWLYGQGGDRLSEQRGFLTTLSALVFKSATAHLAHIGDTRIWRWRVGEFECLTRDHRVRVGQDRHFLSRAMGADAHLEIDYRTVPVEAGDVFLLTTDGVHDFVADGALAAALAHAGDDLDAACRALVEQALANGSIDNLSCQIARVVSIPAPDEAEYCQRLGELAFPPPLAPGMVLDGYRVLRELTASTRSHVYLAVEETSGDKVALKCPSVTHEDDPEYIEHFLHEEWIGRRMHHAQLMSIRDPKPGRRFLYHVAEYIEGQTLAQWMDDHPARSLGEVRGIVGQIAAALRALHRKDMLHQDLKPGNLMIDAHGMVRLIDYGSVRVAGLDEMRPAAARSDVPGTRDYIAPEYLRGEHPSRRSDLYSLGVIAYELLTGRLPYRQALSERTARQREYTPARHHNPALPMWIDAALRKAVHHDPDQRYERLSEFVQDLTQPNPAFDNLSRRPLLERNPVAVWQGIAFVLAVIVVVLVVEISK